MRTAREVLQRILEDPRKATPRVDGDPVTLALFEAASVLPDGHEKAALLYLARNPNAWIVLDAGDKVINQAIRMALDLM